MRFDQQKNNTFPLFHFFSCFHLWIFTVSDLLFAFVKNIDSKRMFFIEFKLISLVVSHLYFVRLIILMIPKNLMVGWLFDFSKFSTDENKLKEH